ncbi:alpha-1,2-fucosyltransferase [Candidatus Atribacteria bacterium HGW-Atribacteria-1]|nr:MAG: alpha-1,2-fucosyltransferase [Candidatus Atribacteria bacterium HGW-Atribacteria-1]
MIGVNSWGRLGNQLFQFAFAYATAKELNTSFFIDESINPFILPDYFELEGYNKLYNAAKRKWFRIRNYKQISQLTYDGWKSPSENLLLLKDNTIYKGFFQSEEYFENSMDDIKGLFKIKNKYALAFSSKYKCVFDKYKTIAVHIRRTDYLSYGDDALGGKNLSLPISYYKNCLERIENIDEYLVIFVSDNIDYVKEKFVKEDNYRFEFNSEIVDFQILLNADILILSNSTFAWWAAYLNPKVNMVLAPRNWLGFKVGREYPVGICKKQWTWVDVSLDAF